MERGVSRPTQWNEDRTRQAFRLALLGATDREIAGVMGVDVCTIEYWKRTKPDFLEALNQGKLEADSRVAESIYRCAVGYEWEEEQAIAYKGEVTIVKVKRRKGPDAWAGMKWLNIRQRSRWADVSRTEVTQTNVNINKLDLSGMTVEELELIKSIGLKQIQQQVGEN
jgi:hypothetical protein